MMPLESEINRNWHGLPHGITGLNFRNLHLVSKLNSRAEINIARDKEATKERLKAGGVCVPPTLGTINRASDIAEVFARLCAYGEGFVVKPARSARGRGILLCRKATSAGVELLSGRFLSVTELLFHCYQILHGEYSFGRPHDTIIIERLLQTDSDWIHPHLPGPPDLRLVLCKGDLLLAMGRLPTRESDGKANLHCGGVGVGIDLQNGRTTSAIQRDRPLTSHPDTGLKLANREVRDFSDCLEIAHRCSHIFKLGFMGIDIMRDVELGPVVLEINARPGLAVQLANSTGLLDRKPRP